MVTTAPENDDEPRYPHNAPCIRCGSYNVLRPTTYSTGNGKLACSDCGKQFGVHGGDFGFGPWFSLGKQWPHVQKGGSAMEWDWCTTDGANDYCAIPDWIYGRRWILQVNVVRSGYWLFLGSTWTRGGVEDCVQWFKSCWATCLTDSGFLEKHSIPDYVSALARQAAAHSKRGGPVPCVHCGKPAFYPSECRTCGYQRCPCCKKDFVPSQHVPHEEVCPAWPR